MTITIPRKLLAKALARLMPYSGKHFPWQRLVRLSICDDDREAPSLVVEVQNGVDFAFALMECRGDVDTKPVAVPLDLLRGVVAASGDDEVTLSWDTKAVVVSDSRSRTRILADKSERPAFPRPWGGVSAELVTSGSRDLCDAIGAAAATAAPTDSRYAISAILVGGGRVVSTDGRVMQVIEAGTGGEGTMLVPARLAAEIARWHAVELFRGGTHAYAMCDGEDGVWLVGTSATEHVFPPWESVVPKDSLPTVVSGDADAIASAIGAAGTMCEEGSPGVVLSVSGDRVEVAARGFAGEAKVVAEARASGGIGLVGLNATQAVRLIKASGAIDDGPLEIWFSEPNRPIVYRRGERWTAVQMPTAGG